jgi:hypothetical protein
MVELFGVEGQAMSFFVAVRAAFLQFFLLWLFVVFYRGFWEKWVVERRVLMVNLWWNVW